MEHCFLIFVITEKNGNRVIHIIFLFLCSWRMNFELCFEPFLPVVMFWVFYWLCEKYINIISLHFEVNSRYLWTVRAINFKPHSSNYYSQTSSYQNDEICKKPYRTILAVFFLKIMYVLFYQFRAMAYNMSIASIPRVLVFQKLLILPYWRNWPDHPYVLLDRCSK